MFFIHRQDKKFEKEKYFVERKPIGRNHSPFSILILFSLMMMILKIDRGVAIRVVAVLLIMMMMIVVVVVAVVVWQQFYVSVWWLNRLISHFDSLFCRVANNNNNNNMLQDFWIFIHSLIQIIYLWIFNFFPSHHHHHHQCDFFRLIILILIHLSNIRNSIPILIIIIVHKLIWWFSLIFTHCVCMSVWFGFRLIEF